MGNIFTLIILMCFSTNTFAISVLTLAQDLFHNYWDFTVSSRPQFATAVGDYRFNDKLDNFTIKFNEETKDKLLQFQNQARELLKLLNEEDITKTNLEVLVDEIEYKVSLLRVKTYFFPISYLDGPPTTLYEIIDYQPMESKNDFSNLVERYNAFPLQAQEIIDTMREGIKVGMVHHEKSLKNYEKSIHGLISMPPQESMFYDPFKKISAFLSSEELEKYSKVAEKSISQGLNVGLQALSDFVKNEYRLHTRKDIASSSLPNGVDFYNTVLNYYVTGNVSPQFIYDMGLEEVKRISKEMENIINILGYNQSSREFNQMLRSNSSMYFKTREEALNSYTYLIRNVIEPKLPQFFKKLPKAELVIKQVPDELLGGPTAYYSPAAPDGASKGIFYLDTSNLQNLPKYLTVTLSLHEAEPGHHLQTSFTSEMEGVPTFRKRVQYPLYAAFMEGWGLYSEYLGNEMGLYDDVFMLYGYLSESIFRACRLVVDTGIHALGWSREQAKDFMLKNSASPENNIEKEIDRYITWPGQACSYKYGETEIKKLRSRAENILGSKFDVKDFHDVVLSSGGSLSFIGKQVSKYISSIQN